MGDIGERSLANSRTQVTLMQNFHSSRSAVLESVETTTEDFPMDIPMDDGFDAASMTDYEYDTHRSTTPEGEDIEPDNRSDIPDFEGDHVKTVVDMSEAIKAAFPIPMDPEYDEDECHIFDDGLEGDDESEDSDTSSNYEELSEPDVVLRVVEVPGTAHGDTEEDPESETDADYIYESPSGDVTDDDESGKPPSYDTPAAMEVDARTDADAAIPTRPKPTPKTLDELRKADLEVQSHEKLRDKRHWKVMELHEARRQIEIEISEAETDLQAAEAVVIEKQTNKLADMISSGLSTELFETYKDFCESLHPEYGLRDGFSITCTQQHNGSYFQYDPTFRIFKENVEMDYTNCNFRCEAGKEQVSWASSRRGEVDDIVVFWPIRCPEPRTGLETTWGGQYPELYRLAIQAAIFGSNAAMKMLMRLPTPDAAFSGWMFEYEYREVLKDEPVVSRRWIFKQARSIDKPGTVAEKRGLLERLLAA